MNSKQTWWLAGTALVLFLFIVFVERRAEKRDQVQTGTTQLVPELRLDQVTGVEIHEEGKPTLTFGRKGLFWMMESPVRYPAMLGPWLNEVARAHWILRLSPEERGDDGLESFGLENPKLRIVIHSEGGDTEIRIGDPIPVGKQVYVQVGNDQDVLVTDELIFGAIPDDANGWRTPALVNYAAHAEISGTSGNSEMSFGRIEIVRSPENKLAVERDPALDRWRLKSPIDSRVDQMIVNSLIFRLAPSWRIEEFVSDDPDADIGRYGLDEPSLELVYKNGTNDVLSVQFGNSPTNRPELIYARQVQFTNVVLTARTNISILQLDYKYWRDRKLISLNTNEVTGIVGEYLFNEKMFSYSIRRKGSNVWEMTEPEPLPVDPELVKVFFDHMNTIPIQEFEKDVVSDFTEYGLAPPSRKFTFGISTNGSNTNAYPSLSFGTNASSQAFARRSDEISVYSIGFGHFDELPLAHWQWRDRKIWSFSTNDVKRVLIEQRGKTRELLRTPDARWLLAPGSSGVVELSFEESVFQMSNLEAERWVAKGGERSAELFGFTDPPHRVTFEVEKNGVTTTHSVRFGGTRANGEPFASVILDGVEWYFDFPPALYYQHVYRSNFSIAEGE